MKKTIYFILSALVVTMLIGCRKGNKTAADSEQECRECAEETIKNGTLLSVGDPEEDDLLPHGIRPTKEVPCPRFESFEEAEAVFIQSGLNYCFRKFIADHPSSMTYSFEAMQQSGIMPLSIADSEDGTIRCYCWNNNLGFRCTTWSSMYQVKDKGKVYTYGGLPMYDSEEEMEYIVVSISQLPHKSRNLYLFFMFHDVVFEVSGYTIAAFERIGHELKQVALFRNAEGEMVDAIGVDYFLRDYVVRYVQDTYCDDIYVWNDKDKDLYLAIGQEDHTLIMTDRYVRCHWDGKIMAPVDTTYNPTFHPSVAGYQELVRIFRTDDHIVRIDSMPDGRMRYTSWSVRHDVSEQPNIMLYGNTVDGKYRFYNNTYTYIVDLDHYHPEVSIYYSEIPRQLGKWQITYSASH